MDRDHSGGGLVGQGVSCKPMGGSEVPGQSLLLVEAHRVSDVVVVSVDGEVDMVTAPQLRPAVERCLAQADSAMLIMDLTHLRFLGSSGLKVLVELNDLASECGMPFRVVVAENRHAIRPLEITNLDKILSVRRTVDDALAGPDRLPEVN